MKKLIFLLLILSYVALPQKSVLTQAQKDSIYKISDSKYAFKYGIQSDSLIDISTDLQAAFDYVNGITKQYPTSKIGNSDHPLLLAQGDKVTLPPGLFVIRNTIDWSGMPKIYFEGAGKGQTTIYIELDSLTDGFIQTGDPTVVKQIIIKNMTILGGVTNTDPVAVQDIIRVDDPASIIMENVFLGKADRYCANFTGDLINSLFTRVQFYEGDKAGLKMSGAVSTSTTFLRCYFSEADSGYGADIERGLNVTFDQCVFESNGSAFIDSSAGLRARKGNFVLISPYFENNYGSDIRFGETAITHNSMSIIGATHLGVGNQRPTIWVDYCYNFTYSGGDIVGLRDTVFKFTENSNGINVYAPLLNEGYIIQQNTSTDAVVTASEIRGTFNIGEVSGANDLILNKDAKFVGKQIVLSETGNANTNFIELHKSTHPIAARSKGIVWSSDTSGTNRVIGGIQGHWADTANFNFYFTASQANVLDTPLTIIGYDQRVGINTTTPTEALDVVGNADISGGITLGDKAKIDSFVVDSDVMGVFFQPSDKLLSGQYISGKIQDSRTYGTELITNGTFDDSTSWTFLSTGWTIDGGVAVADSIVTYSSGLSQAAGDYNKSYKIEVDLVLTSGVFVIKLGNLADVSQWQFLTESGHYQVIVNTPASGGMSIALTGISNFVGTVDNISVKEVLTVDNLTYDVISLSDTAAVTDGYVQKYVGGALIWSPDISTSGSGTFNPDGVTIDTTVAGLARVLPAKVTKWDSVTSKQDLDADLTDLSDGELTASKIGGVKDADYGDVTVSSGAWAVEDDSHNHVISNIDALQDSLTAKANTAWFAIAPHLIDDSLTVKMNRTEMSGYSTTSHTHIDFFDTLSYSINVPDTVIAGDNAMWKIPNNITITEIAAFTNSGTVTFNIEERAETTPNSSGTDVIGSDLVADTDQQETSTFSNASIDRDDWLALVVSSITGDPTLFGVTIKYIKAN